MWTLIALRDLKWCSCLEIADTRVQHLNAIDVSNKTRSIWVKQNQKQWCSYLECLKRLDVMGRGDVRDVDVEPPALLTCVAFLFHRAQIKL